MLPPIRHRGPDGSGIYVDSKFRAALGHTRLSIVDLAGGAQPIHNEDETVWVSFNGEIFNYLELRQALREAGHHFYTQSDTEVIVHAYEQYGDDFVAHLNGQFAIALWDARRGRLMLVRDRVGILPLYYSRQRTTTAVRLGNEGAAALAPRGAAPLANGARPDIHVLGAAEPKHDLRRRAGGPAGAATRAGRRHPA